MEEETEHQALVSNGADSPEISPDLLRETESPHGMNDKLEQALFASKAMNEKMEKALFETKDASVDADIIPSKSTERFN